MTRLAVVPLVVAACLGASAWAREPAPARLELHAARASPFDLAVAGLVEGVPEGGEAYVRWADLRALRVRAINVEGEFGPGTMRVTALYLQDVLDRLPLRAGADTVLADCTDGYLSVFQREFIAAWKPFVILEINGRGPEAWPPEGISFNPAPYIITVSDVVAPGVSRLPDISHKRPWGVMRLRIVGYEAAFAPFHSGPLVALPAQAAEGRDLWVNSCLSCHAGPRGGPGGTKSDRPIGVLHAHAAYNPSYFMQYVRNPKSINPAALMEPHPHYTDGQLRAIMAFLQAAGP